MLGKKKTPELSRRQRAVQSARERSPQPFMYRSARLEQSSQLGRRTGPTEMSDKDRRGRRWISFWGQRAGFVMGTVVLLVCLVELLLLSPDVKIVPLNTGSQTPLPHSTSTYQQAAAKLFASSLTNGNKITVDTAAISTRLQTEFPELSNVSIVLPLIGHRPIVYIQASKPAFILVASGQSYAISQTGHVLDAADQAALAKANLPVITDLSGINPATNSAPLPASAVTFITTVLYELNHAGVAVGALNLPASTQEFDVSIKGQPFFVKFNMQSGTARQQAGTFLALWQYLQQRHVVPSHYVDVRVDGRAYYK